MRQSRVNSCEGFLEKEIMSKAELMSHLLRYDALYRRRPEERRKDEHLHLLRDEHRQ